MRNLFVVLWKYHFFILFFLLEGFSGYLIYMNNHFHQAALTNMAVSFAGTVVENTTAVKEYLHLKETNEALAAENAVLRTALPASYFNDSVAEKTVSDTLKQKQYRYITAKVINNSINKRNNYITLNRGSKHGIKPQMGVITSNGVVGIVKDVSEHFCTVLSMLHKDARISVKINKNSYFGSLVWDGDNPYEASIMYIPKHLKVQNGDSVSTSSYSVIFPEGIKVGTIQSHNRVNLATNFNNLTYVFVVENLLKDEQLNLESANKDAN